MFCMECSLAFEKHTDQSKFTFPRFSFIKASNNCAIHFILQGGRGCYCRQVPFSTGQFEVQGKCVRCLRGPGGEGGSECSGSPALWLAGDHCLVLLHLCLDELSQG